MVRPLPPIENVSLFRAEESELERELRTTLGLATSEDPEPTVSPQSPPQASSEVPKNFAQETETPSLVPTTVPPILDSPNPPVQSSNDMQVEKTDIPPIISLPHDHAPVEDAPPVFNPTPSTIKPNDSSAPASEPQLPPWNPISFIDDEDEEEEEIPSINMDSDSD